MCEYPRSMPQWMPRVYSGARLDTFCMTKIAEPLLFCVLDTPLSLALDTIVLPYTIYGQIKYGNFEPRFVPGTRDGLEPNRQDLVRESKAW